MLFLLLGLIISGCSEEIVSGNVIAKDIEINDDIIKIGVIGPLTGGGAVYGVPSVNAVQMAVDEINSMGGVIGKQIELIVEDGGCDSKKAINSANKLVNIDEVELIVGGQCSSESLAISAMLNEREILQYATLTSSDDYTNAGDYSFRSMPTASYYVGELGAIAYERGAKKIAVVYENKEFPVSVKEAFSKRFSDAGGEVVLDMGFIENERDFSSYLIKIKQEKSIDSIFFASQSEDTAISFYDQLDEMEMFDEYMIFTNNVGVTKNVFDKTNGLIKGVISSDVYADKENIKTKDMIENYKNKFGEYPKTNYYYVVSSYDSIYIVSDAIRFCRGVDTNCIKEYLYDIDYYDGAAGRISFDENGDAITSFGIHYFDLNGREVWDVVE